MTAHGMSVPGEVLVGLSDLRDLIASLDDPTVAPTLTVTDPFDADNNATHHALVEDWGVDQVTATAVSFMSRRATWQLIAAEVWG